MSIGQNDLCERYSKMETEELIELFYNVYNPETPVKEKDIFA